MVPPTVTVLPPPPWDTLCSTTDPVGTPTVATAAAAWLEKDRNVPVRVQAEAESGRPL